MAYRHWLCVTVSGAAVNSGLSPCFWTDNQKRFFLLFPLFIKQPPSHNNMPEIVFKGKEYVYNHHLTCLLYTSPSPRDGLLSRMPSSA